MPRSSRDRQAAPPPTPSFSDPALRLRRCTSVTRAEEIQYEAKKLREAQPDHPCHKPRDSLFSWSSDFDNFSGFVNWAFLLLLIGGLRLMLENLLKYGIRVDPRQWWILFTNSADNPYATGYPAVYLILGSNLQVLFTLFIEKLLARDWIPEKVGMIVLTCSLGMFLWVPIWCINFVAPGDFSLVGSLWVCFVYSMLFLKLSSFCHVNYWCRRSRGRGARRRSLSANKDTPATSESDSPERQTQESWKQHYPENLNLIDIYYFLFAPTLCYELNFPRTSRIRKRFLLKRMTEVVIGLNLLFALFQQWVIPSVKNSLIPFSNMDSLKTGERLLKLAIPNHLLWLVFFYLFFHAFLNLFGELLQFADRDFYGDWWNSENLTYFWRTWNLPVHRWAIRHLYGPALKRGYGRFFSQVLVFFVSAFFHEYLVSVPLRLFKVWAFTGMMSQIPLAWVSDIVEKKFGGRYANIMVWASIIIGQPLCIMMYFHDYVIQHFGKDLLEQFSRI